MPRLLPLLLPALLLAACGQTPPPFAASPTPLPASPMPQTLGGLYQIQFGDLGSDHPTSSAQALASRGLATQGLETVPAQFSLTLQAVQTFAVASTQIRHIRATYLVTNKTGQTLQSPKFLAVVPAGSTTDTVFSSVRYFDGSDASSASTQLALVQGQTYDTATGRALPDPGANAMLTGLDVSNVDITGQGVKSLTQTGWRLANILTPGASALITFGVDVRMTPAADGGSRKDPFSFSLNVLPVQENGPLAVLSSAVKQWDAAGQTFGNYVNFPTMTYVQDGMAVTRSLPAYYDLRSSDGSPLDAVLCPGDAKLSVTKISSAAFPNRWRVEVRARGTHTLNVYAGSVCPAEQQTPLLSQVVSGVGPGAVPIAAGVNHNLVLGEGGTVQSWGRNASGELGDGTADQRNAPRNAYALTGVEALAAGNLHSTALLSNGTVQSWGNNTSGQLGDGTTWQRNAAVGVPGLAGIVAIATGEAHSLALRADGTVQSWGNNTSGQLGDGTTTDRFVPVGVTGLTDVVAISGGSSHSLALRADGTVQSWGGNSYGQLGDGTRTSHLVPERVAGLTNVVAIAGKEFHNLALRSDGMVQSWGNNSAGQLGDGTATERLTPADIPALTNVKAIAAGNYHSLALQQDGTVKGWGDNSSGQLGDGGKTNRLSPVRVDGLVNVSDIGAGRSHNLALLQDGTVWSWGSNGYGQLGDGTTTERLVPARIIGLNVIQPSP